MSNFYFTCAFVFIFVPTVILGHFEHRNGNRFNTHNHNQHSHERFKRQNDYSPFSPDFSINLQNQIAQQIADIQRKVAKELEPIRAMQMRASLAVGQGGTTVATFGGTKILFISDYTRSICPGNITRPSESVPQCTTKLIPDNNTDPCTLGMSFSRVDDFYCFGNHHVLYCETNCTCENGHNYTVSELRKQCGESFDTNSYVQWEYYPNIYHPNVIDLKTAQNMGICENSDDWYCLWHDAGIIFGAKKK